VGGGQGGHGVVLGRAAAWRGALLAGWHACSASTRLLGMGGVFRPRGRFRLHGRQGWARCVEVVDLNAEHIAQINIVQYVGTLTFGLA
jgi:hypothetical protein